MRRGPNIYIAGIVSRQSDAYQKIYPLIRRYMGLMARIKEADLYPHDDNDSWCKEVNRIEHKFLRIFKEAE